MQVELNENFEEDGESAAGYSGYDNGNQWAENPEQSYPRSHIFPDSTDISPTVWGSQICKIISNDQTPSQFRTRIMWESPYYADYADDYYMRFYFYVSELTLPLDATAHRAREIAHAIDKDSVTEWDFNIRRNKGDGQLYWRFRCFDINTTSWISLDWQQGTIVGGWHYFEVKYFSSTNSCQIRLNGTLITGWDTVWGSGRQLYVDTYRWRWGACDIYDPLVYDPGQMTIYLDHIEVNEGNDWIGITVEPVVEPEPEYNYPAFSLAAYPKKQILIPISQDTTGAWSRLDTDITELANVHPLYPDAEDTGIYCNEQMVQRQYIDPDFALSASGVPCRIDGTGNGTYACKFIGNDSDDWMARLVYKREEDANRFQFTAWFRIEYCNFPEDGLENYLMRIAELIDDDGNWVYRFSMRFMADQTLQLRFTTDDPLGTLYASTFEDETFEFDTWVGFRYTFNAHGTMHDDANGKWCEECDFLLEYMNDGDESWTTIDTAGTGNNQTNARARAGGRKFRFGPNGNDSHDIVMYYDDININNNQGTTWISETFDTLPGFDDGTIEDADGLWELWVGPEGNARHAIFHMDPPSKVGVPLAVRIGFRAKAYNQQYEFIVPCLQMDSRNYAYTRLITDYEYRYAEWRRNPETGRDWAWEDPWFDDPIIIFRVGPSVPAGAYITHAWVEVLTASTEQPYLQQAPQFISENYDDGGVTKSRIKVWLGVSTSCNVNVIYGETLDDVKNVPHSTSPGTYLTATIRNNVAATILPKPSLLHGYYIHDTIEDLDPDTTYYFNFLVGGRNNHLDNADDPWLNLHDGAGIEDQIWGDCPTITTFPETATSVRFAFGGDHHGKDTRGDLYKSIASNDPRFMIDLGDHTDNYLDYPVYHWRRGFACEGYPLGFYIHKRMPYIRVWSDHDFMNNNSCKFGIAEFDVTQSNDMNFSIRYGGSTGGWYSAYRGMEIFHAYSAQFVDAPDDFEFQTTTGSSSYVCTVNAANRPIPNYIHPGLTLTNVSDASTGVITAVNRTLHTITVRTPGLQSFTSGELNPDPMYNIGSGQNFTVNDTIKVHCGGLWNKFDYGGLAEYFFIDTRYRRDPHFTPGCDLLDGTAWGPPAKFTGNTTSYVSGELAHLGRDFTSGEYHARKWDVVENTTTREFCHVVSAYDGYLVLNKNIMGDGDAYAVRESGGSDYGDTAEGMQGAKNAGHRQREWLIESIRNSTALIKVICCEMPFKWDEINTGDKWADADGCGYSTNPVLNGNDDLEGNFWLYQAQRNYIKDRLYGTKNLYWLCADRHGAGIDDASDSRDLCPEINASPLHCFHNLLQDPEGDWRVSGEWAYYGKTDKKYDNGMVSGVYGVEESEENASYMERIGGWASVEFTSTTVTATLLNEYNETINNLIHETVDPSDGNTIGDLEAGFNINTGQTHDFVGRISVVSNFSGVINRALSFDIEVPESRIKNLEVNFTPRDGMINKVVAKYNKRWDLSGDDCWLGNLELNNVSLQSDLGVISKEVELPWVITRPHADSISGFFYDIGGKQRVQIEMETFWETRDYKIGQILNVQDFEGTEDGLLSEFGSLYFMIIGKEYRRSDEKLVLTLVDIKK